MVSQVHQRPTLLPQCRCPYILAFLMGKRSEKCDEAWGGLQGLALGTRSLGWTTRREEVYNLVLQVYFLLASRYWLVEQAIDLVHPMNQ